MSNSKSSFFFMSAEISRARKFQHPIVALESTVITHGLPRPDNYQLALDLEEEIRAQKAVPATIALLGGKVHVGLTQAQLKYLSSASPVRKISRRDLGIAAARGEDGGTTVAGTIFVAYKAGIKVFATGGIGGVHRNSTFDISADLPQLGSTPIMVVCAGAKAILDLPATVEYLETAGVPIIGFQTDEFPAFYTSKSGLPVDVRVDDPIDVVKIAQKHWELGVNSAILVVTPPPIELDISPGEIENIINQILQEAEHKKITGSKITPFMLQRFNEISSGSSLHTNLSLLKNNARLAARLAKILMCDLRTKSI
ncbi:MAG: pseudouridine-5'-phosphate glycosidase [Anaerolineaceae bacterium]|nr:pseudouridine-5'-phosphate glycosidase [Anaerolineaceae bacterium]